MLPQASPVRGEKRVVVLYSMPLDFPATKLAEEGLHEVLAKEHGLSVQFFSEYLDLSRFRNASQRQALSDLLHQRYGNIATDLVVTVDVPATHFLMEKAEEIFPGVPVVVCDIPDLFQKDILASPISKRVSGVLEPAGLAGDLVASALRLRPESRHAVLISGAFENDQMRAATLRNALLRLEPRVTLINLRGLSLGEIVDQCQSLPSDSLIFFSTLFVDTSGRFYVPRNVITSISAYTKSPIWGPYDSYFGSGIVGGPMLSMRLQGEHAGRIALRILSGQSPADIPFDSGEGTMITQYDWRQLNRFHLDISQLPPDAKILYREATTWDRYKYYIVGIATLFALESMLVVGLFFNLRQRKKAEEALLASQRELRTLAGRLLSSQEEELSRLSREFHDDFVQRLAAMAIELGTVEMHAPCLDAGMRAKMLHLKDSIISLSNDMHALSRELHPSILKDFGLESALGALCRNFADREGIQVDCRLGGIPERLHLDTALCLYRVTQEGLRNIAKHARARYVGISLECGEGRMVLTIRDDGAGFKPQCAKLTPGIGLASMRERVQYAKGAFFIRSEPGQGTVITVSVPGRKEPYDETENPAG
ncbi:hypothetical protein K9F62_13295 [Desulfovibrio sp. JY]|nr:hypothetical protein K9F62_13295 [Desulfovibrio sp. JY]